MNILITGEKGYLSNRIGKYCESMGHRVYYVSLRNDDFLRYKYEGIDVVFHVAGVVPQKSITPEVFYEVNYEKTKQLFDIILKCSGVSRFVYLSTMATYGAKTMRKNGCAIDLDTEQCPISDYGKSKMLAEQYIVAHQKGIKTTILRVPTLYDSVKCEYFDFYKKLLSKLPCIPYIKANTKRSVLHIDNLCFLMEKIASGAICESVVLPCDKYIPDVNIIMKKVADETKIKKKTSRILGLTLEIAYKLHPVLSNLVGNAYYSDSCALLIDKKSIFDFCYNEE